MNSSPVESEEVSNSNCSDQNAHKSTVPVAVEAISKPSSSSPPLQAPSPLHEVSNVSVGSASKNPHPKANIGSTSLMNGNGELLFRRSPISYSHHYQNATSSSGLVTTPNNISESTYSNSNGNNNINSNTSSSLSRNYYTLGSPSISTSCNSEDVLNSPSLDDLNTQQQAHQFNETLFSKVEQLQKQVEALTDSQVSQEERYKRTKQENDDLLNRIHGLEDQLRELEIISDKRALDDERRFKETMAKQIKLKSQECEQHINTNYQLQQDIISLQKDLLKSESQIRQIQSEKDKLESELQEKNSELLSMDEEVHRLRLVVKRMKDEESVKSNLINILNEELVDNQNRSQQIVSNQMNNSPRLLHESSSSRRSSVTSGFGDSEHISQNQSIKVLKDIDLLEANLSKMREENRQLKVLSEELQAQLLNVQLEEGRSLIQEGNKSYSLADEMGDIDVTKLMEALKEQQDENSRLRNYIDDILVKIVENNPEILEKTKAS